MVKFIPDTDIPDLSGRVIIVTGGTDGLGKESVLQLAKHNPAHIYLAARSQSKATTAIQEIKSKCPDTSTPITFLELDLASFASIKAAAQTFLAAESRLDILMCNAGMMGVKSTTTDGYEIAFGVNHVGHSLFIKLLLPILFQTAKTQPNADVRVVVLGSDAEKLSPKTYYHLQPAEVKSDMGNLGTFARYGQSKIANIHYTTSLAQKYPEAESHVKFVCVHPGAVSTNLGHDILPGWPMLESAMRKVAGVVLRMVTVQEGAKNQLWAATASGVKTGVFYHPVGLVGKGSTRVDDVEKRKVLWEWTEKELEGQV